MESQLEDGPERGTKSILCGLLNRRPDIMPLARLASRSHIVGNPLRLLPAGPAFPISEPLPKGLNLSGTATQDHLELFDPTLERLHNRRITVSSVAVGWARHRNSTHDDP